ncbi:hypothetical protein ACFQNE_14060 [Gordonia phosphorivorans]|uniref:Uncharacterized protein n=1 Tax=Gordonia phosphorivorans TaxID=1056982 RepID=A0ABV6H7I7_9ACTN
MTTIDDLSCCAGCDCGEGCLADCAVGQACPDAPPVAGAVARTYGTGDRRGHAPLASGTTRAIVAVTVPADLAADGLAVIIDMVLATGFGGEPDTTAWAGVDDFLADFKAGLVYQRKLPTSVGDRTAIALERSGCCGLDADRTGQLVECGAAVTCVGYTAGGWWPHCDAHALPTDLAVSGVRRDPDSLGHLADFAEH